MRKRTLAMASAGVLCAGAIAVAATAYASSGDGPAKPASAAQSSAGKDADGTTTKDSKDSKDSSKDGTDEKDDKDKKDRKDRKRDRRDGVRTPRVLHGEEKVRNRRTGEVVTAVQQSGTVKSVSGTSLTVRSSDGVTWTWKLTDGTHVITPKSGHAAPADLESGDGVLVTGTRSGDTRTARTVSDPPRAFATDAREWMEDFRAEHDGQGPGEYWGNYGRAAAGS